MLLNRFILVLPLLFAGLARADQIVKLDRPVIAFADQASPGSVLLISRDGQADWLRDARVERHQAYQVPDHLCAPLSQNTTSMGSPGGLTLVYPFLVGVGRVCYIDEAAQTIRLLRDFRHGLPPDPYSVAYAGMSGGSLHFLLNGRPFPDGTEGYMELITVNPQSLEVGERNLITAVPDLSGAMAYDGKSVWVATWPGSVYRLDLSKLDSAILAGGTVPFAQVASLAFHDIDGMSLFLVANDRELLFYNGDFGDYESYTVGQASGARSVVNPACTPIAGRQTQWLVLCHGNSVETWTD